MITVTTTAGPQQVTGAAIAIDAGHLIVNDDQGNIVAFFAPGVWESAVVVTS